MKKNLMFLGVLLVLGISVFICFNICCKKSGSEKTQDISASLQGNIKSKDPFNKVASPSNEQKGIGNNISNANRESGGEAPKPPLPDSIKSDEETTVAKFDALTDQWIRPNGKKVTIDDVNNYVKRFKALPKLRQNECLQRALNLVPDENIMLLAGILLDKTMDKETVNSVFHDILNRDELVKKPIMKEIFKDKTHPCWADVAWILDVTGELPKAK